jgi:DNA-binding CsgD family transcriptional regulator
VYTNPEEVFGGSSKLLGLIGLIYSAVDRLTPAEARIADLLAGGNEVGEVAARAGITLETARFHVKRVMAKTGVRRQTEMVRLMLSLPGT